MLAAYPTTVKLAGTPVAFLDAPTTKVTANTVYQITDAVKRLLDPTANVVVEVDADGAGAGGYAVADPSTYVVDYLFGKITFAADQGVDAVVRVDGSYLPMLSVAGAREFSIQEVSTLAEATKFGGDGWKRKQMVGEDASGSIGLLEPLATDLDPGAGEKRLRTIRRAGVPVLIEIRPANVGDYWRAWVLLEDAEESGDPEGLVESSVNFQSAPVKGANQTEYAGFGWGQ